MGLSQSNHNTVFLNTFAGKFERKLKSPQPGSITRVNKEQKTIYALHFDQLEGFITKLEYKKTEKYGDFWSIIVTDDRHYKLDLKADSSSTFYFINRLINPKLDLTKKVMLKVFSDDGDNEIKRNVILLYQEGEIIPGVFSKDKPGKLPQPEKVKFKGKDVYDWTKRDEFLTGILNTQVIPKLKPIDLAGDTGATDVTDEEQTGAPEAAPLDESALPDWAK